VNVRDCYAFLKLPAGATLEQVKKAYRKRAFELHPDLNPNNEQAARDFQKLNEAYVILTEALSSEPSGSSRQRKSSAGTGKPRASARQASQRYQKQSSARSEQARPRPGQKQEAEPTGGFSFGKEEVLQNVLKDPFARKVFEDIYREIKKTQGGAGFATSEGKTKSVNLNVAGAQMNIQVSGGPIQGIKNWFRKQMNDEQTIRLLPSQMIPGSLVRLSIRQGLSGKPVTIEVALPPDFSPGKALRLKGLGRKLGPFAGDLFLRIVSA